jgi:hypothetical protein
MDDQRVVYDTVNGNELNIDDFTHKNGNSCSQTPYLDGIPLPFTVMAKSLFWGFLEWGIPKIMDFNTKFVIDNLGVLQF